jgi:hypothetical protein
MKYKDYKFSEIKEEKGRTTVLVRFYEGDFKDVVREEKTVNEYQREKLLETKTFIFTKGETIEDIRKFLNKEMDADVKKGKYKCLDSQKDAIHI